jgi:hypothetical protein
MFFVQTQQGKKWCTRCAMNRFVGISGKDFTAENVSAFIANVRHGYQDDRQGGILRELTSFQLEGNCVQCMTPLTQFLDQPVGSIQRKWLFTEESGEWVPRDGRPPLGTDLDPAFWNRKIFMPFEKVQVVTRDMRVLVIDEERRSRYGAIIYATDTEVVIDFDEKRRTRNWHDIEPYSFAFPGLYLDQQSDACYQAIRAIPDFQFTLSLLSEEERREQQPDPYTWKYESQDILGVADTKRGAIENLYITLCHQGVIDDPTVVSSSSDDLPF